jgi:uncharacterized protein (DUF2267 family)
MPVPMDYRLASQEFEAFLLAARDELMLQTTHQSFTVADSVFRVFRRRVAPQVLLDFIKGMPVGVRSLFIADWDLDQPLLPFSDLTTMGAEAKTLRSDHNLSTPDCIAPVARALRKITNAVEYQAAMDRLPPEARAFWAG